MDDYDSIIRSLLAKQLRHECRFSERQIVMLKWSQINDDRTISTGYGDRRAKISEELYRALMAIPVRGGYVFSSSQFVPSGAGKSTIKRLQDRRRKLKLSLPRYRLKIERVV